MLYYAAFYIYICITLYVCLGCVSELLGTVDFQLDDGTVVFRTCDMERGKVVFQIVRH